MENHRKSKVKRLRKSGFLSRTSSSKGRKILRNKHRRGRSPNIRPAM